MFTLIQKHMQKRQNKEFISPLVQIFLKFARPGAVMDGWEF